MERLAEQAEYALDNATDWTEVFCQLTSLQLSDPLFHASNFSRLPVKLLADVLRHYYETMQRRTNASSVATAKLAAMVCSALGGKGNKVKLDQFLPFELDNGTESIKQSTKEALQWALKNEKMPPVIVGMIGAELR